MPLSRRSLPLLSLPLFSPLAAALASVLAFSPPPTPSAPATDPTPPKPSDAAQPDPTPPASTYHARPVLIAEKTAAAPGSTLRLAIHFKIDPQWHLYWVGLNDSGTEPTIADSQLPEGWSLGDFQWPAPARHVAEGDILDHIYEKELTLILPVTIPAAAKPGSQELIKLTVDWLICSNVCIPESAELEIPITVAAAPADAKDTPHTPLFAAADALHPKPLPTNSKISTTVTREGFTVHAPDAARLEFYPLRDGPRWANLLTEGATAQPDLHLRFRPDTPAPAKVHGVLAIWRTNASTPDYYQINLQETPRP